MRILLTSLFLAVAACGSSGGACDTKQPGQAAVCPTGVVPDTSSNVCKDDQGDAYICRGGSGYCVVCTGADFDNGCLLNSQAESYCVSDCSHC